MLETEIERLKVSLVGDATQYAKTLQDAEKYAAESMAAVQSSLKQVEKAGAQTGAAVAPAMQEAARSQAQLGAATQQAGKDMEAQAAKAQNLGATLQQMSKGFLGLMSNFGVATNLTAAWKQFGEGEAINLRLSAAVEANGRDAAAAAKQYAALGDEIARTTTTTKKAVLGLAQQAESYGVSGDAAERAIKNAVALAAAQGGEADSYLRLTAALEEGHAEALSRMIPALRGITDESEQAAKAQELLGKMLKVAEASGSNTQAELDRLAISFKGVSKEIGGMADSALRPMVAMLRQAVDWWQAQDGAVKKVTTGLVGTALATVAVGAAWGPVTLAIGGAIANAKKWTQSIAASPVAKYGLVVGAAAAAVYGLDFAFQRAFGSIGQLNAALAENTRLQARLVSNFAGKTSDILERASAFDVKDERKDFLGDQLEKAKKQVEDFSKVYQGEKKKFDDESFFTTAGRDLHSFLDSGKRAAEAERAPMEAASQMLAAGRDRVAALQKEIDKLSDSAQMKKLAQETADVAKKLIEQAATAGMSANETERWKLATAGATAEQLKMVDALVANAKAAEDRAKVIQETKDLTKSLQEQAQTWGLNSHEAEVYKLQLRGASDAELKAARASAGQLKQWDEHKKAMEKAAEVTKQFGTPQERLAERTKELGELLQSGTLSWDTYQRAVAEARKQIQGAHADTQKFDAALAGSAEALARVADQRERLAQQKLMAGQTAADAMKYLPRPDAATASVQAAVEQSAKGQGVVGGTRYDRIDELLKQAAEQQAKAAGEAASQVKEAVKTTEAATGPLQDLIDQAKAEEERVKAAGGAAAAGSGGVAAQAAEQQTGWMDAAAEMWKKAVEAVGPGSGYSFGTAAGTGSLSGPEQTVYGTGTLYPTPVAQGMPAAEGVDVGSLAALLGKLVEIGERGLDKPGLNVEQAGLA